MPLGGPDRLLAALCPTGQASVVEQKRGGCDRHSFRVHSNFSAARGVAYAIPVLRQVEVALQRLHTRSPDHALGNGARQIRQRLTFSSPWWRLSSSPSRTSALCSSHPQWQSRAPACSFKLLNLTPILAGNVQRSGERNSSAGLGPARRLRRFQQKS
jgi:hypothetical protein